MALGQRWTPRPCNAPGPHRPIGVESEKQVFCNRIWRHPAPHRLYDEQSFAVLAEWARAFAIDERTRRRRRVTT
jgi:hypothetical protein